MNNIAIAAETKKIIREGQYAIEGAVIRLPKWDYTDVQVYSPEDGEALMKECEGERNKRGVITVTTEDSFQAAARFDNPFVMNFANAHKPGGGFELGATAQEEALCRCSTLIASIASPKAGEMYKYNNTHISQVESDYMLLSKVCVFRDAKCNLLHEPFMASVITAAAPNRLGMAALASEKLIEDTMIRRIRMILLIARTNGYKSLILGAWGCGAFHNNPQKVAQYFRKVLIDEGYAGFFDEICFAIYGREDGVNVRAFRECFGL